MVIRPNLRLAWCAPARIAALSPLIGVVFGVVVWRDDGAWWNVLAVPAFLAAAGAVTFGTFLAAVWLAWSGTVTYRLDENALSAYRGRWLRRSVPVARIAAIDVDLDATPMTLVFSGWWGYLTPLPRLIVTLNSTPGRWDPTNGSEQRFPAILLAGKELDSALTELRHQLSVAASTQQGG